ncbi:MAG TPA: phosphodiester glycosidase family protein [Anaerolineae bacterium]|nr:phosphodiester glycosidase family protein [Anaerolineae bacterium]HIQ12227.1 phosphodiester glycosidase family protein [Caldilineales bacterium]
MVRMFVLAALGLLLAACGVPDLSSLAAPTPSSSPVHPLATFTPAPAGVQIAATWSVVPAALDPTARATPVVTPAATPLPTFWTPIFPGAETLRTDDGLVILRHAAGLVRYGVHFEHDPNAARTVSQWLEADEEALAAVNCGFYWEKGDAYLHMGLLEVNGERLAPVRPKWGAALVVRDHRAAIVRQPKKRIPPMTLGVQGWPTLLWEGAIASGMTEIDDGSIARRTAVGVDAEGRVLWVVNGFGSTLTAFAQRLQEEDIGLIAAVNLDGGASTGLRWREEGSEQDGMDSLPIPCVITFAPLE